MGSPANVPPTTGPNPWSGTYYSICPASDDESGEALILQYSELKFDGNAAWLEDGFELGPVNIESPSISVIACQGHAFSKPQEFLGITPNSYVDANFPGERSYGLDNYTAAADAYRAFFDGESRTLLGTPVHFKDLRHNPPWFDQTTSAYLPAPDRRQLEVHPRVRLQGRRFVRRPPRRHLLLHRHQLPQRRPSPLRPARR
ncbi:hypothetical protein [Nannocystis pusilla]|uniref:hypothetical protein n=1 Tax=Nannocystis pusilla TaxID=889268 RepID=UPI003B79C6C3